MPIPNTGNSTPTIPFNLKHAEDVIFSTFGDKVSIDYKRKTLYKFGRNPDIGTSFETIWQLR